MNKIILPLLTLALLLAACGTPTASPASPTEAPEQAGLANPASVNCTEQGGTLAIETGGDGGQFGVCYFEDNRQCEEWALLRGDCPAGGVKVTGYATEAARYCAITGGTYAISESSGADVEQGTCTFKDGAVCDVWDYYNGICDPDSAPTAGPPAATIQPLIMEVCDGQAQAMAHYLDVIEVVQSEEPLADPVTGAAGTGCLATVTGDGVKFASPEAAVALLDAMLVEQGWLEDRMLEAGGPTGISRGYRKGDQISVASAIWFPDPAANCPPDQPISACPLTPEQQIYTITLNSGLEVPAGEAAP